MLYAVSGLNRQALDLVVKDLHLNSAVRRGHAKALESGDALPLTHKRHGYTGYAFVKIFIYDGREGSSASWAYP